MNYKHPYEIDNKYQKTVAYFSMEFAIDQSLKIYSGGLGFLAGSHMRSSYELKQNIVGIGMLWDYGYYDQVRNQDNSMGVLFQKKNYSFVEETDIELIVQVHGHSVKVKVYYLPPDVFGTAPIYLMSTQHPENDYLANTITHHLYDQNLATRIAQYIVLGVGGMQLIEVLGLDIDVYHFNEAHALPGAFYHYKMHKDKKKLKDSLVFTTHTPVEAGNEKNNIDFLNEMGFFSGLSIHEVESLIGDYENNTLNHTLAMLRISKKSNAVSEKHKEVSNEMWGGYKGISEIIGITNAQNKRYWTDSRLENAMNDGDKDTYSFRKKELKRLLFDVVKDQCGKLFDPNILTVVWARRFAGYKRVDLITRDQYDFRRLITNKKYPVQIIWAGKPYPFDQDSVDTFNHLVAFTRRIPNVAILTGYELALSGLLKMGSDVWLNNPKIPLEASGTSGMTASMNGSINVSTMDGWIKEFAIDGENGFYSPEADSDWPDHKVDEFDRKNLISMIEDRVMPLYYDSPDKWLEMTWKATEGVNKQFIAKRMADEYYSKLY